MMFDVSVTVLREVRADSEEEAIAIAESLVLVMPTLDAVTCPTDPEIQSEATLVSTAVLRPTPESVGVECRAKWANEPHEITELVNCLTRTDWRVDDGDLAAARELADGVSIAMIDVAMAWRHELVTTVRTLGDNAMGGVTHMEFRSWQSRISSELNDLRVMREWKLSNTTAALLHADVAKAEMHEKGQQ